MTVVALSGRCIPEPGYLSMERFEEGFGLLQMTPTALVHHLQTEVLSIGAAYGMRSVAIVACRKLSVRSSCTVTSRMNAICERLFDTVVALATCGRDVVVVNGRPRIIVR